MKAGNLPYDMGNAGDLIKHGVIAEYLQFWLDKNKKRAEYGVRFIDPFGGRPFEQPTNQTVLNRIVALPDCALKRAQPHIEQRYYGSATLVRNIFESFGQNGTILVSDRDPTALSDLQEAGFKPISFNSFNLEDSFSILDCDFHESGNTLLLLDPFAEFLQRDPEPVLSGIGSCIRRNNVTIVLFVLYGDLHSPGYQQLQWFKNSNFDASCTWISLTCPKIHDSSVRGESRLASEILLLLPMSMEEGDVTELHVRMSSYVKMLSDILPESVGINRSPRFDFA